MALREKRKAEGLPEDYEEPEPPKKKVAASAVVDDDVENFAGQIKEMRDKALRVLIDQMQEGTEAIYKDIYGAEWEEGARVEAARTARRQAEAREKEKALAESERRRKEREIVSFTGTGVYLDDFDPRY